MDEDKSADIVDELNKHLHSLSASFFNFVGALQRDAPPASLDGETVVTAPSSAAPPFDVDAQTDIMATELSQGFQSLGDVIAQLPDTLDTHAKQTSHIIQAQKDSIAAGEDLNKSLQSASRVVETLYRAHSILTEVKLQLEEKSSGGKEVE